MAYVGEYVISIPLFSYTCSEGNHDDCEVKHRCPSKVTDIPDSLACIFFAISYCANVGQQGEDYEAITKKAKDCGASKV